MKWNWIFYAILCCVSITSVIAGAFPVIRSGNVAISSIAGISHLVMIIWTAKQRFDNDGDMCMITAERHSLLKDHAEFLRIAVIF